MLKELTFNGFKSVLIPCPLIAINGVIFWDAKP